MSGMKQENFLSRKRRDKTDINSRHQPSSTVEALFAGAIAKVKVEAAAVIAKVKAEAEEKARAYTDTIAKIKAEGKEKAREYTNTIARVKPSNKVGALFLEAVAKQKAKSEAEAAEAIAKVEAEAEEAIAKEKTRADEAAGLTAKVKAGAEEAIAKEKTRADEAAGLTAKVKAGTEEAIAKEKTRADEAAGLTAKVKAGAEEAVAEQKAKSETETEEAVAKKEAKSDAEAEEKARAYTDTIARVKAEAVEAIAKVKAEAVGAIAKVKAEAEEKPTVYTVTITKVRAEEKAAMTDESNEQPISETIQRMSQSTAVLLSEHSLAALALCAKDIMQKELVWGSPDDSVQQTFAKIQQHDAGYMMVGQDGALEGIVSKSDLTGAISPYLRPLFAKWRTPLDDATLQIRIKWIMSRPVHIVSPQTSLDAIMRRMYQFRRLYLPVVDQQGKVQGLVTEANIFKALLKLKNRPNISISGGGASEATCISTSSSPHEDLTHKDNANLSHAFPMT